MKERSKKALASVTPEGKAAMQRIRDRMRAKLALKAAQEAQREAREAPAERNQAGQTDEAVTGNPIEAREL